MDQNSVRARKLRNERKDAVGGTGDPSRDPDINGGHGSDDVDLTAARDRPPADARTDTARCAGAERAQGTGKIGGEPRPRELTPKLSENEIDGDGSQDGGQDSCNGNG